MDLDLNVAGTDAAARGCAMSLMYMFEGHNDKEKLGNATEYVQLLARKHVNQKAQMAVEVPVHLQLANVEDTIGFPMDDPMWTTAIDAIKKKKKIDAIKKKNMKQAAMLKIHVDWYEGFLLLIGSAHMGRNKDWLKKFLKGEHYMSKLFPVIDSNFLDNFMEQVKKLKYMYPKKGPIKGLADQSFPEWAKTDKWPDKRHLFGILNKLIQAWEINEAELRCFWNKKFA